MKKLLVIVAIIFFYSFLSIAQEFNVTFIKGNEYSYKPSIADRLNGISEVIVFAPKNMSEYDKYIYPCISSYFREIGMRVNTKYVKYKLNRDSQPYLETVWKTLDEDLGDYWDNANTLLVAANNVSSFGKVTGRVENTLQIYLIDPVNDFQWTIRFDLPNKSDKFIKKLKSTISQSYSYDKKFSHYPSYLKSNWNEISFKNYFNNGIYNPLEGVYEGDNYKVGVKKDDNGKFYLVYLDGAANTLDWQPGDIKATLEPTATPMVFKAKWYGKWKQQMNFTIIFKDGLMTAYDEDKTPEQYIKLYPALLSQLESEPTSWSGSGFALKNGYIVTNFHVVDGASSIIIKGVNGDFNKSYTATIIASDKNNDLALLKISDSNFGGFGTLPYSISSTSAEVGEDIFVLGYPLTSTMGDEIKLTTGIISSKTGFQGDISLYQISAPIQPGNSGGPLFDKKGNIIGVVSAKHAGAENVGYAIKSSYLRNLIESCVSASIIPTSNTVSTLPLTGKVKSEKNFVFFIECSSSSVASTPSSADRRSSSSKIYNYPTVSSKGDNKLTLISVTLSPESTILEFSDNNSYNGGYYEWFCISPDAYISVNGTKYKLCSAEGIALAPNVTYFSSANETKTFRLTFPPIPSNTTSFDFIESQDSQWKMFGIKLYNDDIPQNPSNERVRTVHFPNVGSSLVNDANNNTSTKISYIKITPTATEVSLILSNYVWCNISPQTYIKVGNQQLQIKDAIGIQFSPNKTYPTRMSNGLFEDLKCTFIFPAIPISTQSIDLIEPNSRWQFFNINISK